MKKILIVITLGILLFSCKKVIPVKKENIKVKSNDVEEGFNKKNRKIYIVPRWKIGDTFRYEIYSNRITKRDNNSVVNNSAKSIIEYKIIDKTEDSFKIEYKTISFVAPKELSVNPMLKKMVTEAAKIKMIYITDLEGTIIGLENWKEYKDTMNKMVDIMAKEINNKKGMTSIKQMMDEMNKDEETILAYSSKNYAPFFTYFGLNLELGKREYVETFLPNIFGGDPIPAKINYELTSINNNLYDIEIISEIDREKGKDIIMNILKSFAKNLPIDELEKEINNINIF